jgi:hypothetical protein
LVDSINLGLIVYISGRHSWCALEADVTDRLFLLALLQMSTVGSTVDLLVGCCFCCSPNDKLGLLRPSIVGLPANHYS